MEHTHNHHQISAEHLLDCVWRLDLDLRITYASPAAASMFGIPADALPGSFLADHTTAEDHARLKETLKLALAADDRTAGLLHETRIKHADGRLIPVEVHSRLLLDNDGRPEEILGIVRDISSRHNRERRDREREQLRLQSQKMEALARLAGGVVGDFQALLSALENCPDLGDHPELAALRTHAAERVGQLHTLAGSLDLRREDVDIDGRLTQILAGIRATLPPGCELVHQPGAGGSTMWVDPEYIDRVVHILVRNACDQSSSNGIVVVATGLRAADPEPDGPPTAPPRPWVTVEVRDNGDGLDHATRERILEPFPTTGSENADTRLDLALAHGIVTQHDGRLEVESTLGQGSPFRVLLPARFSDDILATTPTDDGAARQTVLLVDDDPEVRSYCRRVLRSGGYEVVSCEDGAEALAVIAGGESVDVVVLDWALPGLDGRRVREQIARRQPHLPLLVISGHASKDYEALGGVDSDTPWLAKPFTPPVLLAAVRKLLPARAEAP